MFGLFARHWRGGSGVWIGVLLSLALPTLVFFVMLYSQAYLEVDRGPHARIAAVLAGAFLATVAALWLLVGNWRAASKARAPRRWFLTRWVSRFLGLVGAAATCLPWLFVAPRTVSNMEGVLADLEDHGKKATYALSVENDRLVVTGWVTWSLQAAFAQALDDHPGIRIVVLNGPGGNAAVGLRLAALIKTHHLDTMTTSLCASACTMMFTAGQRRIVQAGARLAFHEVFATFGQKGGWNPIVGLIETRYRDAWRADGIPDDFIEHVFRTPGDQIWIPSTEELMAANVVTEVAN